MHSAKQSSSKRIALVPEIELVMLGLLATLTVQLFRATSHRWLPGMWLETLLLLAAPVVLFWLMERRLKNSANSTRSRSIIYGLQGGALVMAAIVILAQWIGRLGGLGDANEIVALLVVLHVSWYLVVFSRFGSFSKAAFILCCALVLFVCFMAERTMVLVTAFFFATIALWWLLGTYWSRLSDKSLDGDSSTLPVSGFAMTIAVVLATLVGSLAWSYIPLSSKAPLAQISPFSGGDAGSQDLFARAGIGDGNMLTGGENATTTGAVDSDQFIEDDKPSIYDITSEKYDGPKKLKKRKNRAQALDAVAKHLHEVIQSEQAGRSFRTVRESAETKEMDLEHRKTKALFFVEGSVPARFAVDCLHHFDGWDWSKVELDENSRPRATIGMVKRLGKPWFVIQNVAREYLPAKRVHRVKMMRLKTQAIPATPLLKSWHIHRVDSENLFRWNEQGLIRMDGDFIPTHTMIDVISEVPNYHVLRSSKNLQLVDHPNPLWEQIDKWLGVGTEAGTSVDIEGPQVTDPDSPLLQVPDNATRARITSMAKEIAEPHSPGWNQVEAIVNHLRHNYHCDPAMVADDDCEDAVDDFLNKQGGPSYLFATTAVQLLRAAGYRTRLTRGFLVQKEDYDSTAHQSVVTAENMHMWPEVCLDGWHWIPVEPTPGYPIPYNDETFLQWAQSRIMAGLRWIVRNPLISISVFAIGVCLIRFRRELIVSASWLAWSLGTLILPSRRLKLTRQLLDVRFWAAGMPRPAFSSIAQWSSQIADASSCAFFGVWQQENFRPNQQNSHRSEITSACREIVRQLTFRKIKRFARSSAQPKK